ncbi:endonuclease [Pseudomonas aeruginosa]
MRAKALLAIAIAIGSSYSMADGMNSTLVEPHYASTFQEAKKDMYLVYRDIATDQYCGCSYNPRHQINLAGCGYQGSGRNERRAGRTEAEHIVPAENLGRAFQCWREGGRQHCMDTDPEFMKAHNDLHNLMPVVGQVNADRSNYRYAELPGGYGQYGACQFKVDFQGRRAEPPPHLKGDIARIYFYMRDQHGLKLSDQQVKMFNVWSRQDPVDAWELERDARIQRLQGNSNPYVQMEYAGN